MGKFLEISGIALAALAALAALVSAPAYAATCDRGQEQNRSFSNGSGWEFCWEVRNDSGLEISSVYYKAANGIRRQVLKAAHLAELNVHVNGGQTNFDLISDGVFGAATRALTSVQCPGGLLLSQNGSPLACLQVMEDGYAAKHYNKVYRNEIIALTALNKLSTGDYLTRYEFSSSGAISMRVGHAGSIFLTDVDAQTGAPIAGLDNPQASGFVNNYVWRIDPDIGANGDDDEVETLEVTPVNSRFSKRLTVSRKTGEFFESANADVKRSWRVIDSSTLNGDNHIVSYHLEPIEQGDLYRVMGQQEWSGAEFYATRFDPCERLARKNTGGCSGTVMDYVNGESIAGSDVVFWYRTSLYRLPRSEDRDGFDLRWAGLTFKPRDWTATAEF